jgi:MoaA/NifB/PqqE/SkfB family radical SAM enzyme
VDLDLDNIIFSIHGVGKDHDNVTHVKGSYKKSIQNLKLFCKLKKDAKKNTCVMVNCAVLPQNKDSIENLISICKEVGVDNLRFEHVSFLTSQEIKSHYIFWHDHFPHIPMELHQHVEDKDLSFLSENIKALKNKRISKPILFKPDLDNNDIDGWYSKNFKFRNQCLSLWLGVFITPNGDVLSCHTLRVKLGNIKDNSLKDIFNSARAIELRSFIKKRLPPGCARCCRL